MWTLWRTDMGENEICSTTLGVSCSTKFDPDTLSTFRIYDISDGHTQLHPAHNARSLYALLKRRIKL